MSQTSASHPLDLRDPEQQGGRRQSDQTRPYRWSNVTPEQMHEVVALWKSRWKCNQRKDVA
jgi:hypothetical protein